MPQTRHCHCCHTDVPYPEGWYFRKSGEYAGQPYPDCRTCTNKKSSQSQKKIRAHYKTMKNLVKISTIAGGETLLVHAGHKKCSRCQTIKPIKEYRVVTRNADGYDTICKDCHALERLQKKGVLPDNLRNTADGIQTVYTDMIGAAGHDKSGRPY